MRRTPACRHAIGVMALGVAAMGVAPGAPPPGPLYLLGGASPLWQSAPPSTLFRLELPTGRLGPLKVLDQGGLAPRSRGGGGVRVAEDYDRRFVVLSRPGLRAADFLVIHMDAPESDLRLPDTIVYGDNSQAEDVYSVGPPGSLPAIAVVGNGQAVRFPLSAGATPQAIPDAALRDIRTDGFFGVVESVASFLYVAAQPDGLELTVFTHRAGLGIPPPTPAQPNGKRIGFLEVRNDEAVVVTFVGDNVTAPNGLGKSIHHVYAERTKTWHALTAPGSATRVRAFGPWLALVVAEAQPTVPTKDGELAIDPEHRRPSPGRQARSKRPLVDAGDAARLGWRSNSAEDPFAEDWRWYPGTLMLHNVDTGRTYRWDTNQGDSEVILVDRSNVYYRVNETLYSATIGISELENITAVAASPAIGTVHRAFIPR